LHFTESATLDSAHAPKALLYSRIAAEQAEAQFAWAEAERHYERCLDYIALIESPIAAARLHASLGRCLARNGKREAWRHLVIAYDEFAGLADPIGMGEALLPAPSLLIGNDLLIPKVREVLDALGAQDRVLRARLLLILLDRGAAVDGEEEGRLLEETGEIARSQGLDEMEAAVIHNRGERAWDLGDAVAAERFLLQARDTAKRARQPWLRLSLSGLYLELGNLDRYADAAREYLAEAQRYHDRVHEAFALTYLADIAWMRGSFAVVAELNERMIPESYIHAANAARLAAIYGDDNEVLSKMHRFNTRLIGIAGHRANFLGFVAAMTVQHGTVVETQRALTQWREADAVVPRGGLNWLSGMALATEALVVTGDQAECRAVYDRLTRLDPRTGDSPSSLPRSHRPAMGVRETKTGFLDEGFDRARGLLAAALGELGEARTWFEAGIDWGTRERAPIVIGRSLQGLAEVAERRGQHLEAMQHLDAAGELFARHGAKLYLDQVIAKKQILKA